MSKINKIAYLTFGQGINIIVNILFMPYMARALTYEEYGSYGQVIFIVAFFSTLLTLGLPTVINVFLSDKNLDSRTVYSSNLSAVLIFSIIGFILLQVSTDSLAEFLDNDNLSNYLTIYSFSILFTIFNSVINAYLIYNNRVKVSVFIIVVINLLKILLVVISIQVYNSLEIAFTAMVICQLLQLLFYLIITFNKLVKPSKRQIIDQIKMGIPLGMTGILGVGILYTDSLMVSKSLGVKEYAIYRNGAIEVPFISTLYASISAIILPEVTKLWGNGKKETIIELKRKVIMNSIYLIYPILIFVIFNSYEIVVTLVGNKYESSALIFAIFNLTLLVRVNNYSDILIASKNNTFIFKAYLICFIFNIIMNYVCIYYLGSIGAAISTVISIMLLAISQFIKTTKIMNSSISEFILFRNLFKIILQSIIIALPLFFVLQLVSFPILRVILFSIIFFPLIYFWILKSKMIDQTIVEKFLPNFVKKLI